MDARAERQSVRLEQHRKSIREIVAAHHATAPRVFGSVARGDDEVGLRLALTDLLHVAVDLDAADTLNPAVRKRVLHEAVDV